MKHVRYELWSAVCSAAICLGMLAAPRPQAAAQDGARVAVLETRADQIDQHLTSTDANVERLWTNVEAEDRQLAEMQGEERAAWAILTLLTAGNFAVQIRRASKREL